MHRYNFGSVANVGPWTLVAVARWNSQPCSRYKRSQAAGASSIVLASGQRSLAPRNHHPCHPHGRSRNGGHKGVLPCRRSRSTHAARRGTAPSGGHAPGVRSHWPASGCHSVASGDFCGTLRSWKSCDDPPVAKVKREPHRAACCGYWSTFPSSSGNEGLRFAMFIIEQAV